MPLWETKVYSYNHATKQVETFQGEHIEALTPRLAQMWCNQNGKGYLRVTGFRIISEIDGKTGKKTIFEKNYQNN